MEDNRELAGFYLHELEEVNEEIIENIKEYDGYPVSSLAETTFLPVVEQAEATLKNGSAVLFSLSFADFTAEFR